MPLAGAIILILALLVLLWVAFAKDPGPGPADVAFAYESAWDRLDFDLLYDLSGEELRDGLRRDQFVAAKRAAYAKARVSSSQSMQRIATEIAVDEVVAADATAVVVTRVTTPDGSVRNTVVLEKRSPGWTVVGYRLRQS